MPESSGYHLPFVSEEKALVSLKLRKILPYYWVIEHEEFFFISSVLIVFFLFSFLSSLNSLRVA